MAEEYKDDRSLKEKVADIEFEETWEAVFDRHYAIVALVTLCPKKGQTWTEERMLLWLEIVEKTVRLIYGLPGHWDPYLGPSSAEEEHEETPTPPPPPTPQPAAKPTPQPVEPPKSKPAPTPGAQQPRQRQNGNLDAAVLDVLAKSPVTLKRREIAERLGANDSTMNDVLTRLRAEGKIEKLGTSSDVSYAIHRKKPTTLSCEVPGCILAAFPGTTRCERHTKTKAAA